MAIIGYVSISNIRSMGSHALETSTALGQSAIADSTAALTKMGEDTIKQIAADVARQVEMYLRTHPGMSESQMRADGELRRIAVQPVGTTGYTTVLDPLNSEIVIHKFLGQERDISGLRETLPSFWALLHAYSAGQTSGYYDWQEVDGSITKKFASVVPITTGDGSILTLWATTYIEEFSRPSLETEREINAAIAASSSFINQNVSDTQSAFAIVFTMLIIIVIALSLLISWFITTPILALKRGADAIAAGNLDHKLNIRNQDELGELAEAFNKMGVALKSSMGELQRSADANIAKEREIQDNLRLYAQKVGEAQEAERKRIARELHDETVQALVVISRQIEDLGMPGSDVTPEGIRQQIRGVIQGVREFSQKLRPSVLDDLGLVPALESLCADLRRQPGIEVYLEVLGDPPGLAPGRELMVFRVVQEALTNVRKHSGATRASIKLSFEKDNIELVVEDNGSGFAVPAGYEGMTGEGKLGLVGMQERVQLLGGTISIQSQPGMGTTLRVRVPIG
jgi:signal transduction histidine kinase